MILFGTLIFNVHYIYIYILITWFDVIWHITYVNRRLIQRFHCLRVWDGTRERKSQRAIELYRQASVNSWCK